MTLDWVLIIAALIGTGVIAGLLAGLLGVGGGIIVVPVLFYIFQLIDISPATAMSIATGTSLLIIIATSVSSVRSHYHHGNVDLMLLRLWTPFILVGVVIGAVIAFNVGGVFASGVFGAVAILFAINMLFRTKLEGLFNVLPVKPVQALIAAVMGSISVIMGIGGGTIGVSVLTACSYPVRRAIGTSAAFGFVISLPGALLMFFLANTPADAPIGSVGFIHFPSFAIIVVFSVLIAPVGVRLGSVVSAGILKRLFALFLCLSGSSMFYQAIT